MPSFDEENNLEIQGYQYIAGVDEAGRGALAGPVVAAAVVLPRGVALPFIDEIRDSKQLTPLKRESLFGYIYESAISVGVGIADFDVIDAIGIVPSTCLAMKMAIEQLNPAADSLLIDYMYLPSVILPQKGITHGDDLCYSIACASIIAKVSRDLVMVELDQTFSGYGLAVNKGYGTGYHIESLQRLGPSPIHRMTFSPLRDRLI